MAFDPIQECEKCEVIGIQATTSGNIANAFVPIVTLKKQAVKGFELLKSPEMLRLDPHVTVNNPLNLEIVKFTGQEKTIKLTFEVKKGNPKANDSDGGDITIHGVGVEVNPTKVNKKYDSTFELEVSTKGSDKKRNIHFIANDDDWFFDGGIRNVFCGQILIEGVTAAKGYYYAKDGTLLGRIGSETDPTDVMLVNESITQSVAIDLINCINKDEPKDIELVKVSSAVGMKNEELNTRAFMSTLKQAENNTNSSLPYNVWNGTNKNGLILFTENSYEKSPQEYKNHPGRRQSAGSAAGAYQIMYDSWNDEYVGSRSFGIIDFSPLSQDKFIFLTIKYKLKATEEIFNGDIDAAVEKTAKEWRALPGKLTQSKITIEQIRKMFKKNISNELNSKSDIITPVGKLVQYEK